MMMEIIVITFIILFASTGGIVSRGCGGGFKELPYHLNEYLYAGPYAILCVIAGLGFPLVILAYAFAVIGKSTGHGGGMDLGHSPKEPGQGREPEKLEYAILWLHGKIPQYWYDALLLGLTGLLVTVPTGMVIASVNPMAGILIALSGLTKPLSYIIGWKIYPSGSGDGPKELDEATAIGEFLTGFFGWSAVILTTILIV